jgi:uroporphyrinogen-III synthase
MRILVTRPQREAERTAARLAALGHTALYAPMLEIVASGAGLPERPADAVLATSAQAIALLSEAPARALYGLPLFVVGERTAALARAAGFTDVRPSAPDARRLAETIAAAYRRPASFLYLAGRDRKGDLETALASGGHRIDVVIVYAARAAAALPQEASEALRGGQIDAILHYSRRSAAIFRRLIEAAGLADAAGQALNVCISADAAAPLQDWAPRLAVAREPNEAALLAVLGVRDEGATGA